MRFILGVMALLVSIAMLCCACDVAEETADGTKEAGDGAVGIAEKMSEGTLGDALDEDAEEEEEEDY